MIDRLLKKTMKVNFEINLININKFNKLFEYFLNYFIINDEKDNENTQNS